MFASWGEILLSKAFGFSALSPRSLSLGVYSAKKMRAMVPAARARSPTPMKSPAI
jgi:hypothetical protein